MDRKITACLVLNLTRSKRRRHRERLEKYLIPHKRMSKSLFLDKFLFYSVISNYPNLTCMFACNKEDWHCYGLVVNYLGAKNWQMSWVWRWCCWAKACNLVLMNHLLFTIHLAMYSWDLVSSSSLGTLDILAWMWGRNLALVAYIPLMLDLKFGGSSSAWWCWPRFLASQSFSTCIHIVSKILVNNLSGSIFGFSIANTVAYLVENWL